MNTANTTSKCYGQYNCILDLCRIMNDPSVDYACFSTSPPYSFAPLTTTMEMLLIFIVLILCFINILMFVVLVRYRRIIAVYQTQEEGNILLHDMDTPTMRNEFK